jgi:1-acyl-sn-glycerol-3-phosphate acyltransferase
MFYFIINFIVNLWVICSFRIKIIGLENIPKIGGVILCSNHSSLLDPLVLRAKVKRKINFMAKKELFANKLFTYALNKFGVFPVDRNKNDFTAYKKAISIIREGKVLGIFIQGTRQKDIDNAKDGAAMFAIKSGAPVIPIAIISNYKIFSRVNIFIGKKILFDKQNKVDQESLESATKKITEQIRFLIRQN